MEVAAIDLGATSGRVVVGSLSEGRVSLEVVARFANEPVWDGQSLRWDLSGLFRNVLSGIAGLVLKHRELSSIGVDSWAVDYGLLSREALTSEPFHYRDERNPRVVDSVHKLISPSDLYQRNGLQFLPFNTLYQLCAERQVTNFEGVDSLLLVPDLLNFWLTGRQFCERTNASTTGLLNVSTSEWDEALMSRLGIPRSFFPPLVSAGTTVGRTTSETNAALGLTSSINVVAVGSHDTASAVLATPMDPSRAAYISCGTWGLVGVELDEPVLSEEARLAGFTNEGGVEGKVRFLRNVMGLWLLSELVREWEQRDGLKIPIEVLLSEAAAFNATVPIFDVNHQQFLTAGPMQERIAAQCVKEGLAAPQSRAESVRSIIESLAVAFADTVRKASSLSGIPVDRVHLVGGGALNTLLCQLTATRLGAPLVAGPVEATAFGNVLVQLRSAEACATELGALREIVERSAMTTTYWPGGHQQWR